MIQAQRRDALRTSLAMITAIAFLLQSLVTQIHIHGANTPWSAGLAGLVDQIASAGEADTGKTEKHNPSKESACPFCQAAQHAGSFLAPATIVLLPAWQVLSLVPSFGASQVGIDARSHSWHGRAPPRI